MNYYKEYLEEIEAERNFGVLEENRMSYLEFKAMKESEKRLSDEFGRNYMKYDGDYAEKWFYGYE